MKNYFFGCFLAVFVGLFSTLNLSAQDTTSLGKDIKKGVKKTGRAIGKGAKKTGHVVGKGAKKVGNKTAELASKGKAGVVDKVYEEKQGPKGQKIYIDKDSKYYWIDKKGHRHFVAESKLKDKND